MELPQATLDKVGEGIVIVSYIIQADGTLEDIQVDEDPGYGCGDAVLKALENFPQLEVPTDSGYVAVAANSRTRCGIQINAKEGFYSGKRTKVIKPVEERFQVVEEMPRFPGCEDSSDKRVRQRCAQKKMLEFIYGKLKYPADAKANGTEGTTVIRFVVDKFGFIAKPEIVRDIGDGCGEEALRVIKLMPRWNPGKQRGKAVDVYFNMPIKFKL